MTTSDDRAAPAVHDSVAITYFIEGAKAGDPRAAEVLFSRYYEKLLPAARRHIQRRGLPTKVTDEEDVALTAMNCFLGKARQGSFPELQNRDGLWRLLLVITANKVREKQRRDFRQVLPGKRIVVESDLQAHVVHEQTPTWDECVAAIDREPTPEMAAEMAEQTVSAMTSLRNEQLQKIAVLRLQNYTHREIAEQLDLNEKQVERKLRAIRETWEMLANEGRSS